MSLPSLPELEPRRFSDFESELLKRARIWIPAWSIAEGERDFGRALLEIAARFSAEVAERLDGVGDKMARGFLDWLAVQGEAARPARMPVVFKLAETTSEPVLAPHPVKMQVDVQDATVTFETETDLSIVPGQLDLIVGVDPAKDAFYLPPPGLSSLEPREPLPAQWRLKNFAAPGTAILQFDPGLGLVEDMLVEINGEQYRISNPKDDLANINPEVPAGDGFANETVVTKVEAFRPFDGARNQQEHVLYLGDTDLLNIEAEATIEVVGAATLGDGVTWEYWGKDANAAATDADARWRTLTPKPADPQKPDTLILMKPKGTVEPTKVGPAESRWFRARKAHLDGDKPALTTDEIKLRVNPLQAGESSPSALGDPAKFAELPVVEAIVNTTPSPTSDFYPLGREPRLFDTLYLGCAEAFSKRDTTAWVQFELSDGIFSAMSAIEVTTIGHVLAGIDKGGALHLLAIANGTVTRLQGREPMTPAEGVKLITGIPPVMWVENGSLHVGVATKDQVYAWREVRPASSDSRWIEYGSPPATQSPPGPVSGLVLVDHGGVLELVALREKRVSLQSVSSTAKSWSAMDVTDVAGTAVDIEDIVGVHQGSPSNVATRLMAAIATAPGNLSLYEVSPGVPVPTLLIADIAGEVRPFAVELAGTLEVVAAAAGRADLKAKRGNIAIAAVALGQDLAIVDNATISGRLEGGHLVAYVVAESTQGPESQTLVAWSAFDAAADDIAFRHRVDPRIGKLSGVLTAFDPPGLIPPLAIAPGRNKGEVFAAELGGTRVSEQASQNDLRCAISVPSSPQVVATGDLVAVDVGGQVAGAIVVAGNVIGRPGYANRRFFWLDAYLDRITDETTLYIFPSGATRSGQLDVRTDTAPFEVRLPSGVSTLPACLVIDDGSGFGITNLFNVLSFDAMTRVAVLDQQPAPLGTTVDYWLPEEVTGQVFPALMTTPANSMSWTIDAVSPAEMYFPQLKPDRQKVIAFIDAGQHPAWLAFEERWDPLVAKPAMIRFSVDTTVSDWVTLFGDSTSNPALAWEYWNGTGWWHLNVADGTSNLRNSGTVIFAVPSDLKPVDWAGKTNHWIRARLIGGDYGRETVVVVTEPVPNTNKTEQTVKRTTEGIQPPYALNVMVAYAVDKQVVPTFLLTKDSGTLRNQSDANRTPGAMVEVFTPLIYALTHFETAAGEPSKANGGAASENCVPDCECPEGTASTSPAKKKVASAAGTTIKKDSSDCECAPATAAEADTASLAARRALYLGFTSKLSAEAVNVLFVVDKERGHDKLAPLQVDALTGDRFVRIVAPDETRALGETGLLKMSLSVEPVQAELFGKNRSWLRLTPGEGDIEWNPALSGVYLNAVWARAAETMTRELVGSSEGAPRLILNLARPPLLQNSLELRVKEELGEEERKALIEANPDKVKSDVVDLPGDWVLWEQVLDPDDSEASNRVYALDEESGTIRFGDGRHGAIPPAGVDTIVAFKYERTERAADGAVPANFVTARTPLNLVTPVDSVEAVAAADQSAGGVAPESGERVLLFGAAKLRHRGRAVTARDFEDLTLERFAGVAQARCFARRGRIRLVVVMRGRDPQPSRAQIRELKRMLLAASPAALAAPGALNIEGPAVRRLRIELKLRVETLDVAGRVAKDAKDRLLAYFDSELGGEHRDGWLLGASPREEDVAEALLDIQDLESISSITLIEIDEKDRERPWPENIGPRELAMLAGDGVRVGFEIVEAVE